MIGRSSFPSWLWGLFQPISSSLTDHTGLCVSVHLSSCKRHLNKTNTTNWGHDDPGSAHRWSGKNTPLQKHAVRISAEEFCRCVTPQE